MGTVSIGVGAGVGRRSGGAVGSAHSADWRLTDKTLAYLGQAKALALMAIDLLWPESGSAREVLAAFKAPMTKDEYLALQQRLFRTELYDGQTGIITSSL